MEEEIKLGKYQIIKELGRGGFGIVYEAKDLVLDRHVALKVLHGQLTVDPLFLERFEQEAKLAAKLEHPNLVPVYEFGQAKGYNFIAIGLMTGGSLKDHFEKHGALDLWQAKKVLEDVLNGLVVIHENGIVHRDLNPANILFDQYGVARLSDLGFAKALHSDLSHSSREDIVGTAAYMAPEVWYGKETSPLLDIYSLGCIIYEMLTGNALFDADTDAESMTKHLITGPVFKEELPKPWQMLIEKCLAKDPAERYQTAKAVLEDLKFGLFDAAEERQSEIVLSSQDDEPAEEVPEAVEEELSTSESGVSYSTSQGAGSVESSYGKYDDYDYGAPEKEELKARKEAQRASTVRNIQSTPEAPTPGQMLELSPFKRLQIRLPWLLPLSLGVVITLLAVVLVNILRTSNARQFITKATETPTRTYTLEPSHTKVPTNTPIPTNTLEPEVLVEEPEFNSIEEPIEPLGVGSTMLRDKDGMEMVYVPEGTFTMGSADGYDEEKPERNVYLDAYWIDKFEVTNAQFALCVEANACKEPHSTYRYGNSDYADHPVVFVDWSQASEYCEWAGGRLPTEAEWEKAARGPRSNNYPWGNESLSCSLANYSDCGGDTTAVGLFPEGASHYGVMDMAGNVWEWVNDRYADSYDANQTHNPQGPSTGNFRVSRGGSVLYRNLRSAFRFPYNPVASYNDGGFRCAFPSGKTDTSNHLMMSHKTPMNNEQVFDVGSTMVREIDGMEMVYVPEGTFLMGSKDDSSDAWDNEKPQREVYLDAYWIDKYEVSNVQYKLCVKSGECTKPSQLDSNKRLDYFANTAYDNYPVIHVTWDQAYAYCEWAGGRLPTESEWEKAARGTDGRKYPWGNDYPTSVLANYSSNIGDTSAVDSYPNGVSPYGVYNMAGNVWEWVNDWWSDQYDINDTHTPIGPPSGVFRVMRGGSWLNNSRSMRSANREKGFQNNRFFSWGFRCVYSQP